MELDQQLGGIYSLLTVEFLEPYLRRTLLVLQRSNQLPKIPKNLVRPKIVAGVNALGRGQDREALTQFISTIAQTLGPEALMKYLNPDEAIKRLAAAQGIDYLNLIKTQQQLQQEAEQQQNDAANQALVGQAGQIVSSPMLDPTKNPEAKEDFQSLMGGLQQQPPEQ